MLQTKYSVCSRVIKLSNDVMASEIIEPDRGFPLEVVIENNVTKLKLY